MKRQIVTTGWVCLVLAGLGSCGGGDLGPALDLGAITVRPPSAWKSEPPSSGMRKAQFVLGRSGSDTEDASLIVFYFGPGQGGSVEDNLERWYGQFQQADGSSTRDRARTSKKTVGGMPATMADVTGSYSAGAMNPMMPHGVAPKAGYRMLAAIIETPQGPYFLKLTGPAGTVGHWQPAFERFVDQVQKK